MPIFGKDRVSLIRFPADCRDVFAPFNGVEERVLTEFAEAGGEAFELIVIQFLPGKGQDMVFQLRLANFTDLLA